VHCASEFPKRSKELGLQLFGSFETHGVEIFTYQTADPAWLTLARAHLKHGCGTRDYNLWRLGGGEGGQMIAALPRTQDVGSERRRVSIGANMMQAMPEADALKAVLHRYPEIGFRCMPEDIVRGRMIVDVGLASGE
jgi:hypothetical protein